MPDRFLRLWVDINGGAITVGAGSPGCGPCTRWVDPAAPPAAAGGKAAAAGPTTTPGTADAATRPRSLRHIGLSAWDAAVAYRAIAVGPAVDFSVPRAGGGAGALASASSLAFPPPFGPPPLTALAAAAAASGPGCALLYAAPALAEVCRLAPALDALRPGLLAALAGAGPPALLASPSSLAALPANVMADLLAHPALVAGDEMEVYAAVLAWAGVPPAAGGLGGLLSAGEEEGGARPSPSPPSPSSRTAAANAAAAAPARPMADLDALLPLVRFPLMPPAVLRAILASPLARPGLPATLGPLVLEALAAHGDAGLACTAPGPGTCSGGSPSASTWAVPPSGVASPATPLSPPAAAPLTLAGPRGVAAATAAAALSAARHAVRLPPGSIELLHMRDGDANGLIHWLGTRGGAAPWVNPVLSGALSIAASSPPCRTTDPRALAAGAPIACNAAGPDRAGGAGRGGAAWWVVDLGGDARLTLSGYTLRADASGAYPRSWTLQATAGPPACPSSAWHDLASHADDAALHLPGQYASWPVAGPRGAAPWRAFRLLLTGPNAVGGRGGGVRGGDVFALAGLELYGHFWPGKGGGGGRRVTREREVVS